MKFCNNCKLAKPVTSFFKRNDRKNGLLSKCKLCFKKYAQSNRLGMLAACRKWREKNKEKYNAYMRKWNSKNKKSLLHRNRLRKLALIKRTPAWLTKKHLIEIKNIYLNCPKGYAVDHIVPLRGKCVSGLHVPWNLQYLSKSDNSKKSNKY